MPLPEFIKYVDNFGLFIKEITPDTHDQMHTWQHNFVEYINKRLTGEDNVTKLSVVGVKNSGKTYMLTSFCMFMMLVYDHGCINIASGTKSQTKDVDFRRLKDAFNNTIVMKFVDITDGRCKYKLEEHRELYKSEITSMTLPKYTTLSSHSSGRHGKNEVFFIDEADTADEEVLKQIFGSYASGKTFHIMSANPEIESPSKPLSYFGRIMTGLEDLPDSKYNWSKLTIPLDMCDKLRKDVVARMKMDNGYPDVDSPLYRRNILGLYTNTLQGDILFPIAKVKDAIKLVDEFPEFANMSGGHLGVDIAHGKKRNYSVIAYWYGLNIYILFCSNTVTRFNFQSKLLDFYRSIPNCEIHIDEGGIGYTVYEELKNIGCRIYPIKAERHTDSKTYFNKKTQLYGYLSRLIRSSLINIIVLNDMFSAKRNILVEGTSIITEHSEKGKLKVLSKNRTSHTSPDCIDAMSYCFNSLSDHLFFDLFHYMLGKKIKT